MSGYFTSVTFKDTLTELERAAAWYQSLGVNIRQSRIRRYMDRLRELIAMHSNDEWSRISENGTEFNVALYEASELIQIHRGLGSGKYDGVLRERVRRSLKGTDSYSDENINESGNFPRNLAFELLIAERISAGGLEPTFKYGDVGVEAVHRFLVIECKRPQSDTALEKNLNDAQRQFRRAYSQAASTRLRGVVAIDLTKFTNPNFETPYMTQEVIEVFMRGYLRDYTDLHANLWARTDKKTVGVLLRFSMLAACTQPRMMTYCQQYLLHIPSKSDQLALKPFDRSAVRRLGEAFSRATEGDSNSPAM